jgi:hypothetical protein
MNVLAGAMVESSDRRLHHLLWKALCKTLSHTSALSLSQLETGKIDILRPKAPELDNSLLPRNYGRGFWD